MQRVSRLQEVEVEILCGMLPVISWLEQRRSVETADRTTHRLRRALQEAVECAGLAIRVSRDGSLNPAEELTPDSLRVGALLAEVRIFAAMLGETANDIEIEDAQRALTIQILEQGKLSGADGHPPPPTPNQPLRPDQFDLGAGAVLSGVSPKQQMLLAILQPAGAGGVAEAAACQRLRYDNTEKGRKALGQLVKRTNETLNDHGHFIERVNGRYCLTPTRK